MFSNYNRGQRWHLTDTPAFCSPPSSWLCERLLKNGLTGGFFFPPIFFFLFGGMWYIQETEECSCLTDVTGKPGGGRRIFFHCWCASPGELSVDVAWQFGVKYRLDSESGATKGLFLMLTRILLLLFNPNWVVFVIVIFLCEVAAYAGQPHWEGAAQARPGEPTMRITYWLFAFVFSRCRKFQIKNSPPLPRLLVSLSRTVRRRVNPRAGGCWSSHVYGFPVKLRGDRKNTQQGQPWRMTLSK